MSAEGIFVQYVIAELETERGTIRMDVTDRRTLSDGGDSGHDADAEDGGGDEDAAARTASVLSELTYQGPLQPNGTFHIGSFRHLLERLLTRDGHDESFAEREEDESWTLTVRLIASYGPEDRPVGAERTFRIASPAGHPTVVPESWYARQLFSRAERRELARQVREIHHEERSAVAADERITGRDVLDPSVPRETSDAA